MDESPAFIALTNSVPDAMTGDRLDRIAAQAFPDYSRTLLQRWIEAGHLLVDGARCKPRQPVYAGQKLALTVPASAFENWHEPQPVPFELVYEDADLLVVNKPAGVVVHPGAGNFDHTLVNGLLAHRADLKTLPRAGIVHRLDKDTSGLLLIAGSLRAKTALTQMIAERAVERRYLALCEGSVAGDLQLDAPIGRDTREPTRMTVRPDGRTALTYVQPSRAFGWATLLAVKLETGRTHQIRVHLAHAGHPLVGDHRYGARRPAAVPLALTGAEDDLACIAAFQRQALHAASLAFTHPVSGAQLQFDADLPADMAALLEVSARVERRVHEVRG